MTTITLEDLKSDQVRLAEKIAAFERARPRVITVASASISLAEGETYAGLILNDDGTPAHHLVLLPGETKATWADAKAWAAKTGGELPSRREQSLLFANAKSGFKSAYYWSNEAHENGSLAWMQFFFYGSQGWGNVNNKYCARAVRRVSA